MRRTWRPICWTFSNASSPAAIARCRSAGRTHPKSGWLAKDARHSNLRGQGGAARRHDGAGGGLRARLLALFLRLPPGPLGSPGAPHFAERTLGQATLLGDRHRHTQVFRFDSAFSPPDVPRPPSHGRRIRRMIDKWLKAGAVEDGLLHRTTEGSPQGGVISPCLSNVFLHYVLDEWFETEVRPRLKGESTLARFADDAIMAFDNIVDAKRVLAVLGKRLARFGLTLHP